MGFRTLFDASSGAAAFAVAKRLSHLLSTPPGVFLVLAGRVWDIEPRSTNAAAKLPVGEAARRRNSTERYMSRDNSAPRLSVVMDG